MLLKTYIKLLHISHPFTPDTCKHSVFGGIWFCGNYCCLTYPDDLVLQQNSASSSPQQWSNWAGSKGNGQVNTPKVKLAFVTS
jgi:hypothetical protein